MRYALILIFPLVVGILMGMATDGMGWRKSALITVIVSALWIAQYWAIATD
jgi:hypothetical protein